MKITTKKIALTAVLLALAIASQFFKNMSVYVTGSIINLILIMAVLFVGVGCASIIAIVTPVTAFLITGSPIMAAMPLVIPAVMIGNEVLVLVVGLLKKMPLSVKMVLASVVKAAVMGLLISLIIIPTFGPGTNLPEKALAAAKLTFSLTQLITALIGGVLACIIFPLVKKGVNTL
ncbi:MAG: ECF transporter S component [Lachnospiraceae bacterium]|nr:ECF transporter S component [Lachnospiraceae bacterium]